MQFVREQPGVAVQAISACIATAVQANQRVLWLVSGGSNIAAEVAVMQQLQDSVPQQLSSLAVLPMDERYGPAGHADSNSQQLRAAGFVSGAASWIDILDHGDSLEQTLEFYNDITATLLANAGLIVGQFGLGSDGHTAGILPGSPAAEADTATVAGYQWHDYTRLTLTPQALRQVQVGFVLAYGESKRRALDHLQAAQLPLRTLPARLLGEIPNMTIYNDHLESEG